ncbi:MAG: AAA family ATPase [Candidatus Binatia bacterium]
MDVSPAKPPPEPRSYTPKHIAEKILTSRGALEGERKQVTVLFADVKGSMELAESLDPEEWHGIMERFFRILTDGVHRFEGTVNQYTGDGIMALFGAPIAHEDHAQRACYAALALQDDLRRYANELRLQNGINFAVRMGMNSGEVVVGKIGDDLRMDYTALGHTASLAARMEQIAEPGRAYLTERTAKLVDGFVTLQDLGPLTVKGVKEPLRVYGLEGLGRIRTKLDASRSRGFSRFVGRADEMATLEAALARAIEGNGQVVGVVAHPGLGKSRLCFEFLERCRERGIGTYEAHGVSHGKLVPFLPILELFRGFFRINEEDGPEATREKIAGRMLLLDDGLRDALPLTFDFLGVSDPERPVPQMEPEARLRQLLAIVKRVSQARSRREPAVVLLEDLHWFDGGSEAVLEALVEAAAGMRTLLVVNFRPEYHAAWMQRSYYQQLALSPLGPEAIEQLLRDLLGTDPSVSSLRERIHERTGGNPFFIEETVQALAETGNLEGAKGAYRMTRPASEIALPATVQAVLAARIDRLGEREKQVLQTAAVIGRGFSQPVLRHVTGLPEIELATSLGKLIHAELIYEQALYPDAEYIFKHALTQEVAYNSLLNERRQTLHERTAGAIEALLAGVLEEHLSELAHHYAHSPNIDKAIEYSHRAGERAVKLSANAEAIGHLTTALRLLETLPHNLARDERELTLQIALGPPLMATKGYGVVEVETAYARARELCKRARETPRLFAALWGLWGFHYIRGNHRLAQELAEQLLALAETAREPALLIEAHLSLGGTLVLLGDFGTARDHLRNGIELYDARAHRSLAFVYAMDPGVHLKCFLAWALWMLGYPDRALATSGEAVAMAHDLGHPHSVATALNFAASLHQLRREPPLGERFADGAIALSGERGFPFWEAWGSVWRGHALTEQGQEADGIAQIRRGLAAIQDGGAEAVLPWGFALLAEACGRAGRIDEALGLMAEALAVATKNGEQMYEAEIRRLKGELLLASASANDHVEAESSFRRAIDVSRLQQAKSWELRATTSLARLLRRQGKEKDARRILADVYGWFTEGFDTADLKEAKALLEELA